MLFFGVIFVGIFVAGAAAMLLLRPAEDLRTQRRLEVIRAARAETKKDPLRADDDDLLKLGESRLAQSRWAAWISVLLRESKSTWSVMTFLILSAGFAMFGALSAALILGRPMAAVVAAPAFGCLPYMWLRSRRAKRLKLFDAALPDAVELMSRALQAGHSVQQMIEVASEQAREPVGSELAQVQREQNLGVPLREALLALAGRVPSQDLRFVVTAILVQKETGGDLIVILERTSQVIRERMRVAGEVRTFTAQGRLTGWVLTALPVLLLGVVSLITPSYSALLFQDPVGQRLLCGGAVMLLVGGVLIRKITMVEV